MNLVACNGFSYQKALLQLTKSKLNCCGYTFAGADSIEMCKCHVDNCQKSWLYIST